MAEQPTNEELEQRRAELKQVTAERERLAAEWVELTGKAAILQAALDRASKQAQGKEDNV